MTAYGEDAMAVVRRHHHRVGGGVMAKAKPQVEELDVLIEWCAAIDVGQAEVVVCARGRRTRRGRIEEIVRTYASSPSEQLVLGDWLAGLGITDAAMESTAYRKPVYRVLGVEDFDVMALNGA